MPATIVKSCSVFGLRHAFFLAEADAFEVGEQYEYVCPSKCRSSRFIASSESTVKSARRPKGAVVVEKIVGESAPPIE